MNKGELIVQIAGKLGITKKDVANVVDAFIETVTDTLSKGERIILVGFGTFQVRERKARKGRNPQTGKVIQITGKVIQIPAKKVPKFVPGKSLREKVG